jgi:hypothetical protein
MTIDLNDFVAGGYFLARYSKRRYSSERLLPEQLLSISDCHGDIFPVYRGWRADIDQQYALEFGIPPDKLAAFSQWSAENRKKNIGLPDVFYKLDTAQEFIAEFIPVTTGLFLIGIGLHETFVDEFLKISNEEKIELADSLFSARWEIIPGELYGVNRVLTERQSLSPGGAVLGYDIASYAVSFVCSWLCVCAEYYMDEELHVRPNSYGLIPTFETATKVCDSVKQYDKEPTAEYPWLIVQYPLV